MSFLSIVINTCKDYYKVTVPPLLESLEKANVPKECIFIVVGDCDNEEDKIINDIPYYFRRYCNIDNNAMLWITQEEPAVMSEWIIYLHDTSLVAPEFWEKSHNIIKNIDNETTCIKLYKQFSMGMGFYKKNWLYTELIKNYMKGFINYDKSQKSKIKENLVVLEDTLFKFTERGPEYGICIYLDNEYKVVERNRKMYGTDIPRIVEYYENPGIYKIKANWSLPVFIKL